MRRGREVLGKMIVAADTGERLGKVEDIVFDERRHTIVGLSLKPSWLRQRRVLPFAEIIAIGPDAIVARDHSALAKPSEIPEVRRLGDGGVLKGKPLLTSDGRRLGTLVDMCFEEETGHIEGYELTAGPLAKMTGRRQFIPAPETMSLGQDFAVVPANTGEPVDEPEHHPTEHPLT